MTLLNWRGVMVGSDVGEAERKLLEKAIDDLAKSEAWKQELQKRAWLDMYQPQAEFAAFLDEEQAKVATTLRSIGLVE